MKQTYVATNFPSAIVMHGSAAIRAPKAPVLPPKGHSRWTPKDKRLVVSAVCSGYMNLRDMCETYTISMEEFLIWYGQYKE